MPGPATETTTIRNRESETVTAAIADGQLERHVVCLHTCNLPRNCLDRERRPVARTTAASRPVSDDRPGINGGSKPAISPSPS